MPLDLAIPAQVFGAYPELPYRTTLCAAEPGPVRTAAGFSVVAQAGLRAVAWADTVIVPGYRPHDPPPDAVLARCGRRRTVAGASSRSAPARSRSPPPACSTAGAPRRTGATRASWPPYPAVDVDPDVLYVDEGRVLTSAGVALGMDLCLHIVRSDHGAVLANASPAGRRAAPP